MTATAFKIDAKIKCAAPWGGSKRGMAPRIVGQLGVHDTFLSLFCGGCPDLFAKPRCEIETVNDANPRLVNVLRCIRDSYYLATVLGELPFEKCVFDNAREGFIRRPFDPAYIADGGHDFGAAVAQLVIWWMGANGFAGTKTKQWFAQRHSKSGGSPSVRWNSFRKSVPAMSERLKGVGIFCRHFRTFSGAFPDRNGAAIYADPPYFKKSFEYEVEREPDGSPFPHAELAELLNSFEHARVVVSYYDAPELATLYPADRWERHEVSVSKASANARIGATKTTATEILLVNRI